MSTPGPALRLYPSHSHVTAGQQDIVNVRNSRAGSLIIAPLQRSAQFGNRSLQHGQPLPPQCVTMLVFVTVIQQMDQFRSLLQCLKPDLHVRSRRDDTSLRCSYTRDFLDC